MRLALYYPVRPFHVNQQFGANIPCVKDFGTSSQQIVDGDDNNVCPVGYDKLYTHFGMAGHNGTDLQAGVQNVYAAADGTVIEQQLVPARGLGLGILTDTPMDLDGAPSPFYMKLRYWHLKSFSVNVGDHVKAGDLIGISDSTGYSGGNHLHFEGQPMTKDAGGHPLYAAADGMFHDVKAIAGAIDIAPYFNGQYADSLTMSPEQIAVLNILMQDPNISKMQVIINLILSFIK